MSQFLNPLKQKNWRVLHVTKRHFRNHIALFLLRHTPTSPAAAQLPRRTAIFSNLVYHHAMKNSWLTGCVCLRKLQPNACNISEEVQSFQHKSMSEPAALWCYPFCRTLAALSLSTECALRQRSPHHRTLCFMSTASSSNTFPSLTWNAI